jgi:hypothetical protein
VKEADLFQVLLRDRIRRLPRPNVFRLPDRPVLDGQVAVMMPFDARFDAVYEALQKAAECVGMKCRRADDLWRHDILIDDIVSLIGESKVVVCDLTGRNGNVFYELAISHMLAKDVIMITQQAEDVPFDVRHIRYVTYLPNAEGRAVLVDKVAGRLKDLQSR